MLSTASLVLSGTSFYFAMFGGAMAVAAVGFWRLVAVMAVGAAVVGGVGALLLLLSHVLRRWREARRRTGVMLVVVGVLPLPAVLGWVVLLLDPAAARAIVPHPDAAVLAVAKAVTLWRVLASAAVPVATVALGVGAIRSEPGVPAAGFSGSADGM